MDNKIITQTPFEMPAIDDTVDVVAIGVIHLSPGCWVWNYSVGYLKVVDFHRHSGKVTLENIGRIENAKKGSKFPTCMEFMITAPTAVDLYNSMSTCLKADFNSPSEGQEALMSVESTYAMRAGDQVIIDRQYRYLVVQVVNSTTLKVRNEGLGATGIIHLNCDECTPVQVVNQLNCCPIPSGDLTSNTSVLSVTDGDDVLLAPASLTLDTDLSKYDNSVSNFIDVSGVPRGTLSSNSNVLSVSNGANNVLANISLSLDKDLSKYNNTTSGFITLGDVPRGTLSSDSSLITVLGGVNNVLDNIELDLDTDLSKYDNTTSGFLALSDKKDLTSNTSVLTVTNGTGTTLENTSLTLDTDLSKYDNITSGFLASTDKKDLSSTTPVLTVSNGIGAALENVSLTLNTDLSQYDNSVTQFVSAGGLATGNLTSNTPVLTIYNGSGSVLTNTSLTLDTDLSQYDNTLSGFATVSQIPTNTSELNNDSGFITLSDIPALPSDTDLSHYDNSTSGFITSSSLPTVNDATLTIQKNGTDVGTFTANASSNSTVNITVPTDTNDLTNGAGYITAADIPALPSDTDLSNYDNSTSGFITSASLPTVNDAKLTIYESDGVTPFVEFTANASSAVTATLPPSYYTASLPISIDANNDISISQADAYTDGYLSYTDWNTFNDKLTLNHFEETYSSPTAAFVPKTSSSATTYNLGASTNTYNNGYFSSTTINTNGVMPTSSGKTLGNSSDSWSKLYCNGWDSGSNTFRFYYSGGTTIYLVPDSNLTSAYLGSTSSLWTSTYTTNIYVNDIYSNEEYLEIHGVANTNLRIIPTVTSGYYGFLGSTTNRWRTVYAETFNCGDYTSISSNNSGKGVTFAARNSLDNGARYIFFYNDDFYPTTGNSVDLGRTTRWRTIYTSNAVDVSDIRVKDNIEDLKEALVKLNTITVKSYTLNGHDEGIMYGFIAQDELERNPELVVVPKNYSEEEGGGELGYMPNNVLFLAVKAIQELSSKVDALEAKIKELGGKL